MGLAKKRVLDKFPVTNYLLGAREIIQEEIYQCQDVTPYMYILAFHIPAFMRLLKSEGLKL
ncbi:hypothetical protein C2G38_2055842 [Gigaspora rosea]|uniref:Uncharacterized protein n=1 Tax=Gigaspora rosea TaxID=44941 RepID=A0A397WAX3_9GLOM|nr:hypothetical protein C2G38_2055842 [Gigaspora rosea]